MSIARRLHIDRSTKLLVLSNLVTIIVAVWQQWDVLEPVGIYWAQSVIIGFFSCCRILNVRQFSTEGVYSNGQPLQPTRRTQRSMAWFFLLHYGCFHLFYLIFLASTWRPLPRSTVLAMAACILVFLVNHAFSYWYHRPRDMDRTPNIGTMMFLPYARIVPMHLTMLLGSMFVTHSAVVLVFFLSLKMLADVVMHVVENADVGRFP